MDTFDLDPRLDRAISTLIASKRCLPELGLLVSLARDVLATGGTVFWCGNGGSAADSQHLAAELVGRFARDRAPLKSMALTVDTSVLTALGNDYGFDRIFSRQIEALGSKDDLLIVLTTSGRSGNIIAALNSATQVGMKRAAFCGEYTSELQELCDIVVSIPSAIPADIQTAHITLGQMLCGRIEDEFYPT